MLLSLSLGAVLLGGCGGFDQAEVARDAASVETRLGSVGSLEPDRPGFRSLTQSRDPYLALRPVAEDRSLLPEDLRSETGIVVTLGDEPGDEVLARRISDAAGIGVRLAGVRWQGPAAEAGPLEAPAESVRVDWLSSWSDELAGEAGVWSGPLDRLLDAWTQAAGYRWQYDDEAALVEVVRSETRIFGVHALSGSQKYNVTTTTVGAGGEATSGSSSQSISSEMFEEAATVEPSSIAAAAKDLPVLAEAPKGSLSKAATWAAVLLLVAGGGSYAGLFHYDDILKLAGYGKPEPEEPPTVEAVVVTPAFLRSCQAGWDGLRVRMAGFDRRAVVCHPRFAGSETGISYGGLMGRPVLEVRWALREGLDPRVYGPMAKDMLAGWPVADIDDKGASIALSPLPSVLEQHDPEANHALEPRQFRDLLDRTLALRGFDIEYTEFGADAEAVLGTGRPLREAVAMLSAMKGVEVASVSWSEEGGWRFGVRRTRSFMMLESEFDALTQAGADRAAGRSG